MHCYLEEGVFMRVYGGEELGRLRGRIAMTGWNMYQVKQEQVSETGQTKGKT